MGCLGDWEAALRNVGAASCWSGEANDATAALPWEGARHLAKQDDNFRFWKGAPLSNKGCKTHPLQKLHDEKRGPRGAVDANVRHGHKALAANPCHNAGFREELLRPSDPSMAPLTLHGEKTLAAFHKPT